MYVYIGYECYNDYCNVWRSVEVVFDSEEKADKWVKEFKPTETDWREFEKRKVI